MAAKAGVFDFIFKSGAKAAKEMSKGAGAAAKKAPSNVKVVPPAKSATPKYGSPTQRYVTETGRPKIANGRPIPKKVAPAKKAVPGQISPSLAKKKTDALGGLKPREMGSLPKPPKAPTKKTAPRMLPSKPTAAQMKEAQAKQIKWWQNVESQGKAPGGFKSYKPSTKKPR